MTILNVVCTLAICATGLSGVSAAIQSVNGVIRQITENKTVPIMLNIKWITVVLFAFTFVPIDASTAVIQVPIFCPNKINTALESGIAPVLASACKYQLMQKTTV